MSLPRRAGLKGCRQILQTTQRRFASHGSPNPHQGPKTTSFGKGTWGTLAVIPAVYIVYSMSRSSADGKEPAFTRYLRSFESWQKEYTERNAIHTAMLDQAARDKILFYQSKPNSHYNLKYTEWFNAGSPYNVPAGHYMNMDKVIAHYEEENRKTAAKIEEKMANRQTEQARPFWAAENSNAMADQKASKVI